MSYLSSCALSVFVTCNIVNLGAILTDYLLIKDNLPAITDLSVKYKPIGFVIVLFEFITPISLAIHFWNAPRPKYF